MNVAGALMVFLYPLALPLLTLGGFVTVTILHARTPLVHLKYGSVLSLVLVLLLTPGASRGGAGAFALPWWMVQGGSTEFYFWPYLLVCTALLLCSSVAALVYRVAASRSTASAAPDPAVSRRYITAAENAARQFRGRNPDHHYCPSCTDRIFVTAVPSATVGEFAYKTRCTCGNCTQTVALSSLCRE